MRIPRQTTLIMVAVVLVLCSLFLLLFLTKDGDLVSRRNLARIQNGMTKGQVESILGPPTEGYVDVSSSLRYKGIPAKEAGIWKGKKFELSVWFDAGGLSLHKAGRSSETGFLDWLHELLSW